MGDPVTGEDDRAAVSRDLLARWDDLMPGHPALGRRLVAAYADDGRRYHHVGHLADVLAHVDALASAAADPRAVELAAWFHDAVYDVHAPDNEERSALLADAELAAAGVAPAVVAEVVRLVRLTAGHAASPDDANGSVLCDADLAVLARDPDAYDVYARQIRDEYAHVGDDDFKAGRAAVLRQLLDLPTLYRTAPARAWETRARANLTRELADLEAAG